MCRCEDERFEVGLQTFYLFQVAFVCSLDTCMYFCIFSIVVKQTIFNVILMWEISFSWMLC